MVFNAFFPISIGLIFHSTVILLVKIIIKNFVYIIFDYNTSNKINFTKKQ